MDNSNQSQYSIVNIDDIINDDNILQYEYFKHIFEDGNVFNEKYDITPLLQEPRIEPSRKRKNSSITEPTIINEINIPNIQSNLYEVNYQNMLNDTDIYLEINRSEIIKLLEVSKCESLYIPLKIAKINNYNFNMNIVKK